MNRNLDHQRHQPRGTSRHRTGRLAAAIAAAAVSSIATVALSLPAGAASTSVTIAVSQNKTWGPILELSDGQTVYLLTKDTKNHSACSGACAKIWPPVVVSKGGHPHGKGVSNLGTIKRGSQLQVTYEGIPLYTFVGDKSAGDATGDLKDKFGQWYVVNPTHPSTAPTKASGSSTTSSHSSGSVGY